jgi:hypothetical protein
MSSQYAPVAVCGDLSPELSPQPPTPLSPLNPAAALQRERVQRRWLMVKRLLLALGAVALIGCGSVLMFRFIKTDQFNDIIEWIRV